MPSRPAQDYGNIPGVSSELASCLAEFHAQGLLIDAGQESIRHGYEVLRDVGRRGLLEPLYLPEPLRFVVVPVMVDLSIEVMRRPSRLRSACWVSLETNDDLMPHVLWTHRDTHNKKHPVFVGNVEEIDYDSPTKDHWVYEDKTRMARAAIRKGVHLILRTTTQIKEQFDET